MEPTHFEAALNGDISKFPFCNIEREDLSDIFNQVSPLGNSLLHVASSFGQEEMTQLIASKFSFLITKKNSEGNTPLHLAVRAQKLNTVRVLVDLAKQFPITSTEYSLLTIKNNEGNTVLHEALFEILASKKNVNSSVDVACFLVLHDPDVSCHQNNAGKSPLCLAIESGNKEVLEYILNALPKGDVLLQILERKSPVHVAIEHKKMDMLRTIKEQKEELLLLRDEEENTPLHFAASIGYTKEVSYLLEIKSNLAFERNKKGFYPLHLACENGHIEIMKELFRKWPDPTELLCKEGQSILHVAAKCGNDNAVRCILNEKCIDKLVNKMDTNGNTPSHLAALHGHSMVVVTLLFDKRSKTDLVNYGGLTPYDIFKSNILKLQDDQIEVNHKSLKASENIEEDFAEVDLKKRRLKPFQMMMTYWMLYMYYEVFRSYSSMKISHTKSKPPSPKQNLNQTINNLFVVAALLVGAAFAGVLQVPVGDDKKKSDYHQETYKEKNDYHQATDNEKLGLFLFYNVVTMSLSIAASFTLFLALVLDNYLATILVTVAFLLLELALTFMGFAFFWAMKIRVKNLEYYLILSDLGTITVCFQFILMVLVIVPFLTCTLGRKGLSLIIYLVFFCFYFLLYRIWIMIRFNPLKTFIKFVIYCSVFIIPLYVVTYSSYIIVLVNEYDNFYE